MNKNKIFFDDKINLILIKNIIFKKFKKIISGVIIFTLIGVAVSLLTPPLYKSTLTLYPSQKDSSSSIGSLASMATNFGLNLGGDGTPNFQIPDIIRSRMMKDLILNEKWLTINNKAKIDLFDYWDLSSSLNEKNEKHRLLELGREKLSSRVSVNEDRSGLIHLSVLMEERSLSMAITSFIYQKIIEFTKSEHVKHIDNKINFIEKRISEVKVKLNDSEQLLTDFRSKNRKILNSPQLQLEIERLMRNVELEAQVFSTLQTQLELAKIEKLDNSPSVVMLDSANYPFKKSKPNRKLIVISFFILSLIIFSTFEVYKEVKD